MQTRGGLAVVNKTVLSFGAGRQTTAMLILAINGEIERPDVVLFADTGCELPETYAYIEHYIRPFCETNHLPFFTVARPGGTIYDWFNKGPALPVPTQRSCTAQFKIRPMNIWQKANLITKQQIGFSYDEAGRASKNVKAKFPRFFPLIENRITLHDCMWVIEQYEWPLPPKSACYLCCFQSPSRLRRLALREPVLFERLRDLERRAHKRTGYYLIGNYPVTHYAAIEQMGMDINFGCAEGLCFR